MKSEHHDAIVVGSGLTGLAAALGLARAGLAVLVVGAEGEPIASDTPWDARIYAVAPGSVELLDTLGAWTAMPAARIQGVAGMEVYGDRPAGPPLIFDAVDSGAEALAYIAEAGAIQRALWATLARESRISLRVPARPARMEVDADRVVLTFEDGSRALAPLVVGADGARSWVRDAAGIPVRSRAYDQTGVVANFAAEHPHGGIARQWFRPDGILAMLPLPGNHVSMVWSAFEPWAQELVALTDEARCEHLMAATHGRYGALHQTGPALGFPLRWMDARRYVQPRLALVGDAAHNVHPLAGQGVNLGFRDVRGLADTMAARGPEPDPGALSLLRRYERSRREDVATMIAVTDGLQRLFGSRAPGVSWLRNTGLTVVARLPLLRHGLARQVLV